MTKEKAKTKIVEETTEAEFITKFKEELKNYDDETLKKSLSKAKSFMNKAAVSGDSKAISVQALNVNLIQAEIDVRKGNKPQSTLPTFRVYPTFECVHCKKTIRCGKSSIVVDSDGLFHCFAGCNCTGTFVNLTYVPGSGFTNENREIQKVAYETKVSETKQS